LDLLVDVRDNYLHSTEILFSHLMEHVIWDRSMKARWTASYGIPYTNSHIVYEEQCFDEKLSFIKEKLEKTFQFEFNSCMLNFYENGTSSMGFHRDEVSDLNKDSGIVIISLGEARAITFKHEDSGKEVSRILSNGSCLYMNQDIQKNWKHGLKKSDTEKSRISLTWRSIKT